MVLNCNVMLMMSDTLVVEKEQFWRMICCSRLVGTCLAVDLIHRKCSNSHRHIYRFQSSRNREGHSSDSLGEIHNK